MKISYAILVHNESEELLKLLDQILEYKDDEDEIVILDDYSDNEETKKILDAYVSINDIVYEQRHLNKDFASQKNYLKDMCSGDYIVNLDADEFITGSFISWLKPILKENPTIDLYWVSRINKVSNITQEHINKWGWNVNEKGWINYPDYQGRIWKNRPNIRWERPVHEILVGHKEHGFWPEDEEGKGHFSIWHIKDIEKQEKQNEFYDKI